MKHIILCDDGKYLEMSELCKKYNLPVNIDSYNDPEFHSCNPDGINHHLELYNGVELFSIHGTYTDLCFGSRDSLIRKVTKNRFEYSYDMAQRLGCKHVIFHHGYIPGTSNPQNWIKRSKVFWDDFLKDKDPYTNFYIENQFEHNPHMLLELLSSVDDNRLNICLDIGHAHCNSKMAVAEWIKALNKNIKFVHMHNNFGVEDEHLGIGMGSIDILEVCNLLEEYAPNSIWAIESHFNHVEDSIFWLKVNGFLK